MLRRGHSKQIISINMSPSLLLPSCLCDASGHEWLHLHTRAHKHDVYSRLRYLQETFIALKDNRDADVRREESKETR